MRSRVVFGSPFVVVWEAGILEVIGSRGERTRHEVGCLDPPTGQLASAAHRQGIHRSLGGEIGSEAWWSSSVGITARYPVDQALSLLAKMSKGGVVYALRAEQIGVIELG